MKIHGLLIVYLIAIILIAAGGLKLIRYADYIHDLSQYKTLIIPKNFVIITLPWMELTLGCAIVLPKWRAAGAGVAFLLFSAFALITFMAFRSGATITCGCFWGAKPLDFWTMVLAAALAMGSLVIVVMALRDESDGRT